MEALSHRGLSRNKLTCIAILAAFFQVAPSSANAWKVFSKHPDCPTIGNNYNWNQWLTKVMPDAPGAVASYTGVEFRYARQYNDPEAIGNLDTRYCYGVLWQGAQGYFTWRNRPPDYPHVNHAESLSGQSGNPAEYEINVYGVVLLYTDLGEVIDRDGRVVGQLVCYISNECGGY